MLVDRCVTAYLAYAVNVNALAEYCAANITVVVDGRFILTLGEGEGTNVTEVVLWSLIFTLGEWTGANVAEVVFWSLIFTLGERGGTYVAEVVSAVVLAKRNDVKTDIAQMISVIIPT